MSEEKKEQKNKVVIKKLPNSEIEIEGEIPAAQFESYYKKTVQNIGKDIEIAGFRKGHVPEKVLVEKIGENALLHEMAEEALSDVYPKIIIENNIEAIGRPDIAITKLARSNPFGFKVKTAVLPSFELPDYKTIAKRETEGSPEKIFVEDKEVEDVVAHIRKQWGAMAEKKKGDESNIVGPDGKPVRGSEKKDGALPDLTDEFVKKLGDFKDVLDFKEKLKENLMHEKTAKVKEKRRIAIIEALLKEIAIVLPALLVESEMDRMLARFKGNISSMGHTFEDYLAQIKKTEKELREGWRADAEKNVKVQLLLQKIAEAEKITVPEEEIKKEIGHVEKHYPKADKARARQYIEGVLLHEKVFQFLENDNSSAAD